MAFQLVDDALDYIADPAQLGKTVGDDFREGKLTYPVLLAFADGDSQERAFWQRTIESGDQSQSDLGQALTLITRHNAIARTIECAREFAMEARAALSSFPACELREILGAVADYTISRNH
jgi:octaprenyl-diphosphate synthase